MRFALLTLFVLLGGGAIFWWFGPGQPDPVHAIISHLPQPAADLVTVAVRKSGFVLPEPSDAPGMSTEVEHSSSGEADVPAPELVAVPENHIGRPAGVMTNPDGVARPGNVPGDQAGGAEQVVVGSFPAENQHASPRRRTSEGVNLRLEPSIGFRSLPRIKSALFSESRRLVVFFPLDRYELTPPAQEALAQLSASLAGAQQLFTLRIDGHCDDTGDAAYNQGLSERRARAVRDFLLARGLTAESTVMRGFGERIPVVAGEDTESRARNRRAEIWVEWVESRKADAPDALLESAD